MFLQKLWQEGRYHRPVGERPCHVTPRSRLGPLANLPPAVPLPKNREEERLSTVDRQQTFNSSFWTSTLSLRTRRTYMFSHQAVYRSSSGRRGLTFNVTPAAAFPCHQS